MTKVLVIEDELPLCEEITDTLKFEGFNVFAANDGRAGLELALKTQPDLIICDITMPQMDGYTVLSELRKHPEMAATPFMFLTARADRSFMRHGMELGADDYLTKPFTRGEFMAAVQTRLERQTAISDSFTREMEEVKTTLTRLVAHELRTPLVSMRMVTSIVERQIDQLSPPVLSDLVADMNAGMDGTVVTIDQILLRAVELGRRFAYRGNDCKVHVYARDRDVKILAHTQALKHGLAELVANALNFSNEDGEVAVTQWLDDNLVRLAVLDQGIGMSSNEQDKAFQRFVQFNRQEREQQGMGLGLLVARGIIEAHGGTIQLESVPKKGTQITVSLPLVESQELSKDQ